MKIALTGGIAQGKSTVLEGLRRCGVSVASADEMARECFEDSANAELIARTARMERPVNRDELRRRIGAEPQLRRAINSIIHPCVLSKIRRSEATVIEVPLLIESAVMSEFDAIWCVTCAPEEQRRRLAERLGSEAEADRLIAIQLPSKVKETFAEEIIRTDGDLDRVFKDIQQTAHKWSLKGLRA